MKIAPAKSNEPVGAYIVLTVVLITFFDMFSQLPIISPHASLLGAGVFMTGLTVAMYSLTNMVGNFFAGRVISLTGKVNAIFGGMLVAGAAVSGYALVNGPGEFLLLRAVHGLGTSVVVPAAYAYLGNLVSRDRRGKEMSKTGIAIGVAALTGPAFGGIMKDRLGVDFVFWFVATCLVATALLARWILRDQLDSTTAKEQAVPLKTLLNRRGLLTAYIAAFSLMFAKGTMAFSLPLYADSLGYSGGITGALFSSFALAALLVFATPLNRVSDRVGRFGPLCTGLFLIGSSLILLLLSGNLAYLLAVMFLYGIGFGFLFPTATALVLDQTYPGERGTAFGLFYGIFSLGVVVGPVLSGFLAMWGVPSFLVGGSVALLGVFSLLLVKAGVSDMAAIEGK